MRVDLDYLRSLSHTRAIAYLQNAGYVGISHVVDDRCPNPHFDGAVYYFFGFEGKDDDVLVFALYYKDTPDPFGDGTATRDFVGSAWSQLGHEMAG